MISYLQGKTIFKNDKFIIINVAGVGYKVFLASSKINTIVNKKEVSVFCSLKIKKDSWDLYGFLSLDELNLFDFLMKITGIGPKAALEISSLGSLDKIKKAVTDDDQEIIQELFKSGKKKAQAIIFEITRELKNVNNEVDPEIKQYLSKLGFSKKEIKQALSNLTNENQTTEQKIKEALKILGK